MNLEYLQRVLQGESARQLLKDLYGEQAEKSQARYLHVAEQFCSRFKQETFELFSSPGRTEIGGNHTDHNHGRVLAASINLDCAAAAAKCEEAEVTVISEGYEVVKVSLKELEPAKNQTGTSALLRGILAGFLKRGYKIGGFMAYVNSNVISAAGVSSSASFEMLICTIIDYFYNQSAVDVVDYAHIGKYAENQYWKKQSGLLDQMACAVGGLITIDFKEPENPRVEKVDFSFEQIGYDLVIVNTGKGHADLSEEYSSIPREMKQVAGYFQKDVLADLTKDQVLSELAQIRAFAGDRAVLRALHFFAENQKVEEEVAAIKGGDYEHFLKLISMSGNSSWKWLQNCYSKDSEREQSVAVALALTELFLVQKGAGVCRVHGGGFAGVIMAALPRAYTLEYTEYMEDKLGERCVYVMNIRKYGAIRLNL